MTNKYKDIKMKTSTTKRSEEGFAAVTVMVISLLGGLIVFDTVKENINQERMAGNYSKELNARLQAENGLAEAYNMLSTDSTLSTDDMMTQLNSTQNSSGGYYHNIDAWLDGDNREVNSSGFHHEGTYAMRGSISLASGSGNNVFNNSITTCDGATLGGSGTIDSYDSSEGAYNSSNPGNNGDVSVLNEDASGLHLSGGTLISGNASINGDLSVSNGYIYGDAHVSGNVTVANSGSASVGGSIQAMGDVSYTYTGGTYIAESISSNGDVSIGNSSFTGDITYGGDDGGTLTSAKDISTFSSTTENTSDHVNAVGTQECDILAISDEFANTADGIGSLASHEATTVTLGGNNTSYVISDSGLVDTDNNEIIDTQTETIDFLGKETDVYVLDINGFTYGGLTFTVESGSNVTIYLSDDTFFGGSIKVEDGATLTILTESTIEMGSNGTITNVVDNDGDGVYETTTTSAVNSNNEISTTIYSNYNSADYDTPGNSYSGYNDYAISVAGGNASTFSAYTANGSINISGGGDIYGSLRADYLNVTGGAGVHFDERISGTNIGDSDSSSSTPEITRWF